MNTNASTEPLPPGWVERKDPSGRKFYESVIHPFSSPLRFSSPRLIFLWPERNQSQGIVDWNRPQYAPPPPQSYAPPSGPPPGSNYSYPAQGTPLRPFQAIQRILSLIQSLLYQSLAPPTWKVVPHQPTTHHLLFLPTKAPALD